MNRFPQLHKQFVFKRLGLIVGRQDFLFVVFQFGCDVSFRIFESLFANVIDRDAIAMRIGDF